MARNSESDSLQSPQSECVTVGILGPCKAAATSSFLHPVSFARAHSREAVLHDAHRTARVMVWDAPGALHAQYLGSPRFALGHIPGKGGREALVSLSLGAGSAKVFL